MTPAARLSAAIEVLSDIGERRRPASDALKDWGLSHRFAGSGDRAAIAGLAYDALRRKSSAAWIMGQTLDAATPRAMVLGMLRLERHHDVASIARLADGERFAPAPLNDAERSALDAATLADAPPHVAGDYPDWLDPYLTRVFGDARAQEGAALASRAPLDLRVNTLKGTRDEAEAALAHLKAKPTKWSPHGLRVALPADGKAPAVQAEPSHLKGLVEVQDQGSQLAALFACATPGETVVDLCAGAGGKTLALAAAMERRGRLFATDLDKRRLAPLHARLERAGAKFVQTRTPDGGPSREGGADPVADLAGEADLVLVDAPCTGTGTWRRNPDAKWRMRPGALEIRQREQAAALDRAALLLKPGGRIVYVTCSLLAEENGDAVATFMARQEGFAVAPPAEVAAPLGEPAKAFLAACVVTTEGLLMTPRRTGTDGFFVSVLRRAGV